MKDTNGWTLKDNSHFNTDATGFTRKVQVETSLYDDGTVREVEITFTVSQFMTLSIEEDINFISLLAASTSV